MGVNPTEPDPNNPSDAAHPRAESLARVIGTPRVERWFRSLVQNSSDIITLLEADGTIRYQSPSIERILGYHPEELVGDNAFHYVHPEDLGRVETAFAEGLKDPRRRPSAEYRFRHKEGPWVWLESVGTNLLGDPGVGEYVVNSRDITERKRYEEALRESEERFRSTFDQASIGMAVAELNGRFMQVNRSLCEMLGYSEEELLATTFLEITHPDDLERDLDAMRRMQDDEVNSFQTEKRCLHADGHPVWVSLNASVVRDPEVAPLYYIAQIQDITERKRTEEALRRSESSLATAQRIAHLGNWDYDITKDEARWSDEMYRIFGFAPQQFVPRYRTFLNLIHPDDRDLIRRSVRKALYEQKQGSVDYRVVRPDGEVRVVQSRYEVVRDTSGRAVKLVGTVHDITERKEAEDRLSEAEERYRLVARATNEVIWDNDLTTDAQVWDGATAAMFGYSPEEMGDTAEWWEEHIHSDDRERVLANTDAALRDGWETWSEEYRFRRADGTYATVVDRAYLVRDAEGRPVRMLGSIMDVTERKRAEERMQHQALHDPLTDLPNRQLLLDRLGHALARTARRRGSGVAVLFMDLDGFKVVNDSLGHDVGDRLLVAVAERLKGCLRPEGTLARFAGDEFIMLLEEVEGADEALRVTQRITEEFRGPFVMDGRDLVVRFSIGVALGEANTKSPEELLRDADIAMYRAKKDAADYRVFDPQMHEQALSRLELENDLRRALDKEEFTVYYQPKFRLLGQQQDRIEGFEALVRWEHPQRGFMLPDEFIPIAEETGLIIPIGGWVMKEACHQAKEWQERYPSEPPLAMCVNLSAAQVRHPGLLKDVRSALQESGLEPDSLILEITENTLLKGTEVTETVFKELKALGVRLAIDDFGKEYSSLSYLNRLPVDGLKIDRSFLESFGENPSNTTIVEAVIALAHSLGLEVTGEGVESAEQLGLLRGMGCDFVQGYHLARPMPPEDMPEFLAQ